MAKSYRDNDFKISNYHRKLLPYEVLDINNLTKEANRLVKHKLLDLQLEISGYKASLATSTTQYGGTRFWFCCPKCNARVGKLYKDIKNEIACRKCLKI